MATVASNIICAWVGNAADIPSGWSRKTAWDTYYVLGAVAGSDPSASSGGNTTHIHTSPTHNPIQNSHTHSITADVNLQTSSVRNLSTAPTNPVSVDGHTHSGTTPATTATNDGIAITVNTTSNDPPYVKIIWIESNGTPTGFPSLSYIFFDGATLPTNWTLVQANKFLKGADALGDGGATGGSLDSHTHTSPAHIHTSTGHSHTVMTITGTSGSNKRTGGNICANRYHTHDVNFSTDVIVNQSVTTTISSSDGQPPFKKLVTIRNDTGANSLPDSSIAIWASTAASIPTNWERYTNMDGYFLKSAANTGEIGTTGGANQHLHTASACQPIQNSHSHTPSDSGAIPGATGDGSGIQISTADAGHYHDWTDAGATATNNSISVTIDNCTNKANYPPYYECLFIKYTAPIAGAKLKTLMGVGQ